MTTTYTLTYFPIKALGEPIRFVLAYAEIPYEDNRIERDAWQKLKPSTPYGKLPTLQIGDKVTHQSVAITRYLGKEHGLGGKTAWEDLQIDMAVDSINDFRQEISSYHNDKDENSKAKKLDPLVNTTIPFYLEKFEKQIKENGGYLANGKLSWGDLYFIGVLDYINFMSPVKLQDKSPSIKALEEKVLSIPQIKKWVAKRPQSVA